MKFYSFVDFQVMTVVSIFRINCQDFKICFARSKTSCSTGFDCIALLQSASCKRRNLSPEDKLQRKSSVAGLRTRECISFYKMLSGKQDSPKMITI